MRRAVPIRAAKAMGPARSPTHFSTPRALSAKAEAHCETDCSQAPAHIIITKSSQKMRRRSRVPSGMSSTPDSSASVWMGTCVKTNMLSAGTTAQMRAATRQCSMPKTAKKTVESSTTPI